MNRRQAILSAIAVSAPLPVLAARRSDAECHRIGVELAIELLENADLDESNIETDEHRDGRPQDNILARYLERARSFGDPRVELALCAVLSDLIASCADLNIEIYERLIA